MDKWTYNDINYIITLLLVKILERGQYGNKEDFFTKTMSEYEDSFGEKGKGEIQCLCGEW